MMPRWVPVGRRGFSLVESLTAVTVTAIAGGALLVSLGVAVQSSTEAADQAMARGLAEQLMDEIAAARFPDEASSPSAGSTRESFENLDDYHLWSERPPRDRWGRPVGTEGRVVAGVDFPRPATMQAETHVLDRLTRSVTAERVRPDGAGGWQTVADHTPFRRVTVRVTFTDMHGNEKLLAEISRIFSHVPAAP